MLPDDALAALRRYPLLAALRERRSRRFGLGMAMPEGPLAYRSRHPGLPLTEGEEALLAFAACGITGAALADLAYAPGQGATIMAGLLGRTIGSGDAIQSVAVVVTNAEATYLLKRPRDFARGEKPPGTEMFRTPARRALRFWKSCDVPPGARTKEPWGASIQRSPRRKLIVPSIT